MEVLKPPKIYNSRNWKISFDSMCGIVSVICFLSNKYKLKVITSFVPPFYIGVVVFFGEGVICKWFVLEELFYW